MSDRRRPHVRFTGTGYVCEDCGTTDIKNEMAKHAHVRWCRGPMGISEKLQSMLHTDAPPDAASNSPQGPVIVPGPDSASNAASRFLPPQIAQMPDPAISDLSNLIREQGKAINELRDRTGYLAKLQSNHLQHIRPESAPSTTPPPPQSSWWQNPWFIIGTASVVGVLGFLFGRASALGQEKVLSETGQALNSVGKKAVNKLVDRGINKALRGAGL